MLEQRLFKSMAEMLNLDYQHLYKIQYMLMVETFFRMLQKASFEEEWYSQGYLLFEQFVKTSSTIFHLSKLIEKYLEIEQSNFEYFTINNKEFLM